MEVFPCQTEAKLEVFAIPLSGIDKNVFVSLYLEQQAINWQLILTRTVISSGPENECMMDVYILVY